MAVVSSTALSAAGYVFAMLEFVLADEVAQQLAADRPGGLAKLRGVGVRVTHDLVSSAWAEMMKTRGDEYTSRRRPTDERPLWAGAAHLSVAHARAASTLDGLPLPDTLTASLGGDDMQVTGNLELHPDRLIMNTHTSSPVDPFTIHPVGPVHVTGVIDGNEGDNAFVVTLPSGPRIVIHLGRASKLAEHLGTLRPG